MAKDHAFDLVSKVDLQEVKNAVNIATKEIQNRFDFKKSISRIELSGSTIKMASDDEGKLKSVIDILESKLVKRGIALKAVKYGKVESALGGTVKQEADLVNGIPTEKAKDISKLIRDMRIKVQPQVQGDLVRVSSKNLDDLQKVINYLKEKEFDIPLQFVNYR